MIASGGFGMEFALAGACRGGRNRCGCGGCDADCCGVSGNREGHGRSDANRTRRRRAPRRDADCASDRDRRRRKRLCFGDSRGSGSIALIRYFHSAKMDGLAGLQSGFFDRRAIDESAIGRAEVPDDGGAVFEEDLAMRAGNGRVVDLEIVRGAAPQGIASRSQLNLPSARRARINQKPWHNLVPSKAVGLCSRNGVAMSIRKWGRVGFGWTGLDSFGSRASYAEEGEWRVPVIPPFTPVQGATVLHCLARLYEIEVEGATQCYTGCYKLKFEGRSSKFEPQDALFSILTARSAC
jgi:hypothetical protein